MQYSLGIDAGGTYTDAVIVRDQDGMIMESGKVLTSYPDPIEGIRKVIDGLTPEYVRDVRLVCISTTLSTNAILENTGFPVGVILVGDYVIPAEGFPSKYYVQLKGGHTSNGEEEAPLDEEGVLNFAKEVKNKVAAFAVSSFFSNRNSDHELRVRKIVRDLTGLPVVCGHELSQELGAYDRSITAYLNAQLLPITHKFIGSVMQDIRSRGINASLLMLKCDGSVIAMEEALERPIESIFSGPAASLAGASYLTGYDTCIMVDVGGTSTDVALIHNGVPKLSDHGAIVGGWKTMVKAIRMETIATGGDSHVWIDDGKMYIGPRRVIPLCRAVQEHPGLMASLQQCKAPSRKSLSEQVQPASFFVRTDTQPMELSVSEDEIYDAIHKIPISYQDLVQRLDKQPLLRSLEGLIQKRLIQMIAFTPTDALHVLGEFSIWDSEASKVGAEKLSKVLGMSPNDFCQDIRRRVARNMAHALISYLVEDIPTPVINRVLSGENFTRFKLEVPVVLIGGPVAAFREEMGKLLDAELIVPEHSDVGNAVGALAGKGIKRVEVLIKRHFAPVTGEDVTLEELKHLKEQERYFVFTPQGRHVFQDFSQALEFATEKARSEVMEHMRTTGHSPDDVDLEVMRKDMILSEGEGPVETRIVAVGIASSRIEIKKNIIPDYMSKKAIGCNRFSDGPYADK